MIDRAIVLLERDSPSEAAALALGVATAAECAGDARSATVAQLWSHVIQAEVSARSRELEPALRHLRRARSSIDIGGADDLGPALHLGVGGVMVELEEFDGAHSELTAAWASGSDLSPLRRIRCALLLAACAAERGHRREHDQFFDLAWGEAVERGHVGDILRRRADHAVFRAADTNATEAELVQALNDLTLAADDSGVDRLDTGAATRRARTNIAQARLALRRGPLERALLHELVDAVSDDRIPHRVRADAFLTVSDAASDPSERTSAERLGRRLLEPPGCGPDRSLERLVLERLAVLSERRGDDRQTFDDLRRLVEIRAEVSAAEADRTAALAEFRLDDPQLRDEAMFTEERVAQLEARHDVLSARAKRLAHDATTDRLTGLGNRRSLDQHVEVLRRDWPSVVSVAIVDADLFKRVNDGYGHVIGDAVLRRLAEVLRRESRANDLIARVGGEEFAVVLRGAGPAEAADVMERLRVAVEHDGWGRIAPGLAVTVSIGVATAWSPATLQDAFRQADHRLYDAKGRGRNRVVAGVEARRRRGRARRSAGDRTGPLAPVVVAEHESPLRRLQVEAWDAFDQWDHDRVTSIVGEWRSDRFAGSVGANVMAAAFEAQLAVRDERERDAIEAADTAAFTDDGSDDAVTIDLHTALGYVMANLGECDRAMDHLGVAWLRSASVGTDAQRARTAYLLGLTLQMLHHEEHALSWFARGRSHAVLAGADRLRLRWSVNEHEAMLAVAGRHEKRGALAEANAIRTRVAELTQLVRPEMVALQMPRYPISANRLMSATASFGLGDHDRAMSILESLIADGQDQVPDELIAIAHEQLARVHLRVGDAASARRHSRRALEITERPFMGHNRYEVLDVDADAAAALGQYHDAVASLRSLLRLSSELAHDRAAQRARISEIRTDLQLLARHTRAARERARELADDNERLSTDVLVLERQVAVDALTGIANRATLERALGDRLAAGARPFALAVIDIDHFKRINDTLGHQTGDAVLARVATAVEQACRGADVVGRWGGDEFVVILDVESSSAATSACDRLRRTVATTEWAGLTGRFDVRISVGAAMSRAGDDLPALFERADAALYRAKSDGRDRVVVGPEEAAQESARPGR